MNVYFANDSSIPTSLVSSSSKNLLHALSTMTRSDKIYTCLVFERLYVSGCIRRFYSNFALSGVRLSTNNHWLLFVSVGATANEGVWTKCGEVGGINF